MRSKLITAVALLIALNVWRWWPADAPAAAMRAAPAARPGDDVRLAVRGATSDTPPPYVRNLFQLRRGAPIEPSTVSAQARPLRAQSAPAKAVVTPPGVAEPVRTPEEIETDGARAELDQVRLVGVIFRDAKPQAYFAHGDRTYMVTVGGAVSRFTVTAISAESAKLYDARTNIGRVIPVLGQ